MERTHPADTSAQQTPGALPAEGKDSKQLKLDDTTYYRIKNQDKEAAIELPMDNSARPGMARLGPKKCISLEGRDINDNPKLHACLTKMKHERLITVRDTKIELNKEYIVRNRTARRIGIVHYETENLMILPPFGSRQVSSDFINGYDLLPWLWQKLVEIEPVAERPINRRAMAVNFVLWILFIVFLSIAIPTSLVQHNPTIWWAAGTLSLVFVSGLAISQYLTVRRHNINKLVDSLENILRFLPGFTLVMLVGIGLPMAALNFRFSNTQNLSNIDELGKFMQVLFISIAAILPALLYYLFGRMQIDKQRESFFREALVLDPHIESYTEAENKYDPLLDSVYGTGNSPFSILLLVISTALLVMGWMIALTAPDANTNTPHTLINYFSIEPTPFKLGFLGAYFFAINMIFRRYVRSDLTPKTYAYITVRLLITIVLVWAISTLPQFTNDDSQKLSLVASGLLVVCFIIGIFPDWGMALLKDAFKKITRLMPNDDNGDELPLSDLEGMNLYDRARLLEEGIENIENLAHHNLMELIARTRIPTSRLVDMFDQAILYIHLGMGDELDDGDRRNDGAFNSRVLLGKLKSYGIRTASGLINAVENRHDTNGCLESGFNQEEIERLRLIAFEIRTETWLSCILNWSKLNRLSEVITEPYMFYQVERIQEDEPKEATAPEAEGHPSESPKAEIIKSCYREEPASPASLPATPDTSGVDGVEQMPVPASNPIIS